MHQVTPAATGYSPLRNGFARELFDRISSWEARIPDQLLYSFLDANGREVERHTYHSFVHRFHSIAVFLSQHSGLTRGDRVVLVFPPGLDLICAIFACVRAGLIPVPTNAPMGHSREPSLRRLISIVNNSQPSHLLSNSKGAQILSEVISESPLHDGNTLHALRNIRWLNTDDISDLDHESTIAALQDVVPSDIFLIQYTSGSTSDPKGVIVTVENIIANAEIVVDHVQPVCVSWLPQHHDMGLLGYYIYIVLHGGTTYGFSPGSFIQRPLLWLELISKYRATATSVPNFALEMCLNTVRVPDTALATLDLSSLRFLMAAAEPINSRTYTAFATRFKPCMLNENAIFVAYGLAEFTLAVTNYGRNILHLDVDSLSLGKAVESTLDDANTISLLSCGSPLPGNNIVIVNPDTKSPCDDGVIGEVWVDGRSKAYGYWNNPTQQAETFQATIPSQSSESNQTYLRTGDMGFVKDQELYICGRHKEMIVIRGQNYFPQDIEKIVHTSCPELRPRAVVAFEYKENEHPKVALVIETKIKPTESHAQSVVSLVRSQIGLEVNALSFVPAKTLPKTTSGKLMRLETKKRWLNNQLGKPIIASNQVEDGSHELTLSSAKDLDTYMSILASMYGVKGDETCSIADIGIDSIELVTLISLIKDELEAQGAHHLAEQVDIRLLQAVSIAEFYKLHGLIKDTSLGTSKGRMNDLLSMVENIRNKRLAAEMNQMKKDSTSLRLGSINPSKQSGDILLTGGTGFLGPFILKSLLQQTPPDRRIKVLVRASQAEEALSRIRKAFLGIQGVDQELVDDFHKRVHVVCGNLEEPNLSLSDAAWHSLAASISTIYHNGAIVNYLMSYGSMRDANVIGTRELLRLAAEAGVADFNHISTTFIFGWAKKSSLLESDNNDEMGFLDFGYSQSKWVSEQLVLSAGKAGLPIRIFRPSLITPSVAGDGTGLDISLRLLLFMIKHGITVDSLNQVSFTPVDATANNIVAIAQSTDTIAGNYHVVRDDYHNMLAYTDIIGAKLGIPFKPLPLKQFVDETIRLCTSQDPLFPLLDFLIHSEPNISAMEFKRYDSTAYQAARNRVSDGVPDPSLVDTVSGILSYLSRYSPLIHHEPSRHKLISAPYLS